MSLFKKKPTVNPTLTADIPPSLYAQQTLDGFIRKANHNKRESIVCFTSVIVLTLVAPLLIAFGDKIPCLSAEIWTRVIPAIMSVSTAGFTAWLQLRKPQQLWSLYRDAQRRIEDAVTRCKYGTGEFADNPQAEKLLVERIADIAFAVHKAWVPLVPNPENLKVEVPASVATAKAKE